MEATSFSAFDWATSKSEKFKIDDAAQKEIVNAKRELDRLCVKHGAPAVVHIDIGADEKGAFSIIGIQVESETLARVSPKMMLLMALATLGTPGNPDVDQMDDVIDNIKSAIAVRVLSNTTSSPDAAKH